jgi:predicted RNA-binding Zn ribbon-like protein
MLESSHVHHKELESATKTGLMLTAAKAATHAAQKPPLDVSNTSQFRDLVNSSSRIFGWNTKAGLQTQFNQVVISQEQLDQIRALRASMTEEEKDEIAKRQATPEGEEELARVGKELQERAQNMEQPKLPGRIPIWPRNLRSEDKGRWRRLSDKGDEGATP